MNLHYPMSRRIWLEGEVPMTFTLVMTPFTSILTIIRPQGQDTETVVAIGQPFEKAIDRLHADNAFHDIMSLGAEDARNGRDTLGFKGMALREIAENVAEHITAMVRA